jgi:phosphoglycerate dehydrogenase-like enzyme
MPQKEAGMERPVVTLWMTFDPLALVHASDRDRLDAVADVDWAQPIRSDAQLADPALLDRLARTRVLLTCWGALPLTAERLRLLPELRAAVHGAGSLRSHCTPATWASSIAVSTSADANAVPVAEFTVAAIVLAGKRVFRVAEDMRTEAARNGKRYDFGRRDRGIGLYRTVIGIIGASRVGRRVIELLRGYDVEVLLHDPTLDADGAAALGVELVELDDLMRRSRIVSLHAPNIPATRHLLDADRFALLEDGATFINTARGALVDHDALLAECRTGRLWAILDVTDPEPLPPDSEFYDLPNVTVLPHLAGTLGDELHRMGAQAVDEVLRVLAGEPLRYQVTAEQAALQA